MYISRIKAYARATHIKLEKSPWQGGFRIKGFSPHLRTVHLLKNSPKQDEPWVLHDILHIFFYDYVYLNTKNKNIFLDQNRFFEIHLASEAFAVLALDYYILSEKKNKTITVDFYKKNWAEFCKINPRLPYYKSYEFIKNFTHAYFTGDFNLFLPKKKLSTKYKKWILHEISYSQKQRAYVTQWWNDLQCIPRAPSLEICINGSEIDCLIFSALQILFGTNNSWKAFLKLCRKINYPKNYFAHFKKFKKAPKYFDYRFTDMRAIPIKNISNQLQNATKPSSSNLFLMWQIFAQFMPKDFSQPERKLIEKLYLTTQKQVPSSKLWKANVALAQKFSKNICPKKTRADYLGNFFLF